jgi:hypothetical protein
MNKMGKIKKSVLLCLALLTATASMAISFTYELSYEGFPYHRTQCSGPSYMIGATVTLSSYIPVKDGKSLVGWRYKDEVYMPGASFKMPAEDVVLEPVWETEEGLVTVTGYGLQVTGYKMIRDGQLIIVRDGVEYNVLGGRIQ